MRIDGSAWRVALVVLVACVWAACGVQNRYYSVAPTSSNTVAQLDAKYGFGDLRFGQPPTSDLRLFQRDQSGRETYVRCPSCPVTASINEVLQECQRRGEHKECALADMVMMIGTARIAVYYEFYKNQLTTVELEAGSQNDNQPLLEALRYAYGPGERRQADEFKIDNSEGWSGKYVDMDYLEPRSSGVAIVWIKSKWLSDIETAETDPEGWRLLGSHPMQPPPILQK